MAQLMHVIFLKHSGQTFKFPRLKPSEAKEENKPSLSKCFRHLQA